MRVVHLLRKYNPAEWGGTETAIHRLFDGLRRLDVSSVVYAPRIKENARVADPLVDAQARLVRARIELGLGLREAADKDYQLTVLADLCADMDDEVHRVLTEKVFPRQATVTTSKEWLEN